MAANKSTYARTQTLNSLLTGTTYLALFVSDPGLTGTGTEVTGGSYARKPITWSAVTDNRKSSTADINFTGLPSTTVNYWAIFDAATGGNLLYFGPSTRSATIPAAGTYTVLAGNLIIEEE